MTLRLVVFDVDGTLIDSQAHIYAAMAQAFEGQGLPVPPRAEILGIVGLSLPQAMARLAPALGPGDRMALVEPYRRAFAQMRQAGVASPLFPGAREVLEGLARQPDLLLGIATGKSRRGLTAMLAAHDLAHLFTTVQVADDHPSKPHPAMLGACLRETGVSARDTVMLGDTSFDMDMARAAGVGWLGVAWGYHPPSALGDIVVAEFADVPAALDAIWARETGDAG